MMLRYDEPSGWRVWFFFLDGHSFLGGFQMGVLLRLIIEFYFPHLWFAFIDACEIVVEVDAWTGGIPGV